jgi:hypothetical protein
MGYALLRQVLGKHEVVPLTFAPQEALKSRWGCKGCELFNSSPQIYLMVWWH